MAVSHAKGVNHVSNLSHSLSPSDQSLLFKQSGQLALSSTLAPGQS